MSERYAPGIVPAEYDRAFFEGEFWKLRMVIDALASGEEHNAEPAKVWTGLLVQADGTNWNPGSGAGPYIYKMGTGWIFLG
jgi:hypothetical protein